MESTNSSPRRGGADRHRPVRRQLNASGNEPGRLSVRSKRAQAIHPATTVQSELSRAREALAEVLPYREQHGIGLLA
jgi:hypothetical protein